LENFSRSSFVASILLDHVLLGSFSRSIFGERALAFECSCLLVE
jgi:hypothetical protein